MNIERLKVKVYLESGVKLGFDGRLIQTFVLLKLPVQIMGEVFESLKFFSKLHDDPLFLLDFRFLGRDLNVQLFLPFLQLLGFSCE